MRVVFDTNILYSALAAKGFCEEVVDEAAGAYPLVWSNQLREELEEVLTCRHKIGPATQAALSAYADLCEFVEPHPLPKRICRDKDDDVVLATAVAGRADIIVTGDADLLILKNYQSIRIITPRQFLKFLDLGN